ncbi:MAG: hypothetical protein PHG39_10425 [Acidithiobacillus ferrooxidans]|jgi:hypothetical protein|uniref:Uncharacterized protein n=1 Tax=Acidithiobacillus ferruginosus TaxID=3063951 RepID=A0ACD5IQ43_9PROT|nr:hypothetical protein [Acidithiobacillus ferruginosus]MDD2747949.1 hypothetical protein [Acidithiobacillus ferrooxidans]MDD5004855.1 hypothetical protein [Acidithiobacillus sp.]MBU2813910.1 hypothetical protein [Acidithiobacillus ferruginosus]MDD5378863.1 hypothetical protein [Acidithiobacillus sp.]MDD5575458.1 hypothetical protein [Acidithiobacillus sp.]
MNKEGGLISHDDRDDGVWDGNIVLIIGLLWAIIALGGYYVTLRVLF